MYFHGYELILNSIIKSMISQLTQLLMPIKGAKPLGTLVDVFGLNRNHCSL